MEQTTSISTSSLAVGYGRKILINNIEISVEAGKILTLLGPNGSGKSTILRTITGELKKLSGNVIICGSNTDDIDEKKLATHMSMVMTQRVQPELMSCREIISLGRYPYTGRLGILSDTDKAVVEEAMKLADVSELADRPVDKISDGQRQRVMLAKAICQEPDVLILDEPTSYLDIKYKLELLIKIRNLAAKKNIAVVMSLHEPDLALKTSDFIMTIDADGNTCYGSPSKMINQESVCALYGISDEELAFLKKGGTWWNLSDMSANNELEGSTQGEKNRCKDDDTAHMSEQKDESGADIKRAKAIMIQGTMSGAGKSLLVAALCRIFSQDGYRVAPFKSQNMALNSYITEDGLEMGRAQVMQAECARVKPSVYMNPILLKPTDDVGSQVIVNGEVVGNMKARDYFEYKKSLVPDITAAYEKLSEDADIIVIEGAGSPAEINLKENDIVNMGLADILDVPVLLAGDIDRGGVFAQLVGTVELLTPNEKARIKGLIINKFRGDSSLLDSGIEMLTKREGIPVTGVVPYMNIRVEDEDSLSDRLTVRSMGMIDIAVIRLPHISNFTDMNVFEQLKEVSVRYVSRADEVGSPDMLILPGTKNTTGDLRWIKEQGLDRCIKELADQGVVIWGICGGYQMLGESVDDRYGVEQAGTEEGLALLPIKTVLARDKKRRQYKGKIANSSGIMTELSEMAVSGYEIHMGETDITDGSAMEFTDDNTGCCRNNIYGTYIHGVFDNREVARGIVDALALRKGVTVDTSGVLDYMEFKETQYNLLADTVRKHMDMDAVYAMLGIYDRT